jgi:hypothetical protein
MLILWETIKIQLSFSKFTIHYLKTLKARRNLQLTCEKMRVFMLFVVFFSALSCVVSLMDAVKRKFLLNT